MIWMKKPMFVVGKLKVNQQIKAVTISFYKGNRVNKLLNDEYNILFII